ncbi:hypothetical protein JOE61_004040 [Nocardioides salarius]|uniref:Uncharacterized protein n=1 Tax=Nocardioides salarius TaxID=374513 RepID=A0ABS2MGB1_9ACTN|nr:hypothetical protein [Nocardioides salarius]MBM7510226.1 hypothetical protein [Nocardioides salarius]
MPSILLSATSNLIEVIGVSEAPPPELLMPLFPDLTDIRFRGDKATLEGRWTFGRSEVRAINVRAIPTWSELTYGALRFWHGESHAIQGRVVVDAAMLVSDGLGLLVIGSGKSHFAARCAKVASVITDDTVVVDPAMNKPWLVGTGWRRRHIRSRTGQSLLLPPEGPADAQISAIAFVEGSYGRPSIQDVSEVDARSWLLQASLAKVLNTRSKPPSFCQAFIGSSAAAQLVADQVSDWRLPSFRALGNVEAAVFWEAAIQCAA